MGQPLLSHGALDVIDGGDVFKEVDDEGLDGGESGSRLAGDDQDLNIAVGRDGLGVGRIDSDGLDCGGRTLANAERIGEIGRAHV